MKKIFMAVSFAMLLVGATFAQKQGDGVYVLGASISFSDSTVYFTEIQLVDSVALDKGTKFLPARQHYAYELKDYMAFQEGKPERTSVIFFSKKISKLKKKEARLKNRLEKRRGLTVRYLGDKFKFTRP